jgi:ribosomal RNA-processing protein 1
MLDKKTRDKAVKGLAAFLSSQDGLPPTEMAKLWKGIFYCFWMSDKPLVQQALASELAELLLTITSTDAALAFLRGFWQATVREWNGIDRLRCVDRPFSYRPLHSSNTSRMDKYYMLVRRFVNASFRLLQQSEWSESVCEEYNSILTSKDGPLTCVTFYYTFDSMT